MFKVADHQQALISFLSKFNKDVGKNLLRLTPLSEENRTFSLTHEYKGMNKVILFRMSRPEEIPIFEKNAATFDDLKTVKVKLSRFYIVNKTLVVVLTFNNKELDVVVTDFNVLID